MKIIKSTGELPSIKPIKERMDIFVPDVSIQLPRRRGFVYGLCGSGGSGKSSLLLSMFKSKAYYRGKFDNVWLFVPQSSFLSVEKHPFQNHEQVYHELTVDHLHDIHDRLDELKEQSIENGDEIETSLIIIDDMADHLKDKFLVAKLNAMIIKSRHLSVCWIFTLQSYNLMNLTIRKQFTNTTIFNPKNNVEWDLVASELLHLNKDDALKLKNYVFDEPYNHLDIDTFENKIYKNFELLTIDQD
jgi:ABC-type dipeptide/oligopeptide/nickel transport system ATPase component